MLLRTPHLLHRSHCRCSPRRPPPRCSHSHATKGAIVRASVFAIRRTSDTQIAATSSSGSHRISERALAARQSFARHHPGVDNGCARRPGEDRSQGALGPRTDLPHVVLFLANRKCSLQTVRRRKCHQRPLRTQTRAGRVRSRLLRLGAAQASAPRGLAAPGRLAPHRE